ncbi:hypothetical protein ONE63_000207 [Megalurothrips usitatus]|uniref:Uncharacterized protein n=1 Tax=Megalurothrips usitatus TaxID=439358 RepID=A0AAV7Y4J8_9NEOP|nr:hypothetical protein ONE63_000207 [Megalurothrips usitatus]
MQFSSGCSLADSGEVAAVPHRAAAMFRAGLADGLTMAELGESNHGHGHGPGQLRKDSACDNDLWPPDACEMTPLPPPPRPFVRMGSTMTGSEASLPGPRRKEQRRQEWLNSEILNAVLSGEKVDKVAK